MLSATNVPGSVVGQGTILNHQDFFGVNALTFLVGGVASSSGQLTFFDKAAGDTFNAVSFSSVVVSEATPVSGFTTTNGSFTITGLATLNGSSNAGYHFLATGSLPFPSNPGSTGGVEFMAYGPNGFSYTTPWRPWDAGETVKIAIAQPTLLETTTHLTASANPTVFEQPVTFTAKVAPVGSTSLAPAGYVSFAVDGNAPVIEPVVNGQATYSTTRLGVGTHQVVATYLGTSLFASSASTLTQVTNKASTATTLSYSGTFAPGHPFALTARVSTLAPSYDYPTGIVTFLDNGKPIGTVALAGTSTVESATLTLPSGLSVGSHQITAVYGGDPNTVGSTSNAVSGTVASPILGAVTGQGTTHAGQDRFGVNVLAALVQGIPTYSGSLTFSDAKAGATFTAVAITSLQIYESTPVKGPSATNGYFIVTGYATLNGGTALYAFTATASLPFPANPGSTGGLAFQANGPGGFSYSTPWSPWDKGETVAMTLQS